MNTTIKVLSSLIVGIAIGYFGGQLIYKKKYEAYANEEINDVKETFDRMKRDFIDSSTNVSTGILNEEPVTINNVPIVNSTLGPVNPYEDAKKKYNLIKNEEETVHNPEEELEGAIDPTIDRTQPYLIDEDEYNESFEFHDKISLFFYTEDFVLTDEDEQIVDPSEIFGDIDVDRLPTMAWVRNEPFGADYEIMQVRGSYGALIHGIREDDTNENEKRKHYSEE